MEALKQIRDNLINGWRNSSKAERIPYVLVVGGFASLLIAFAFYLSRPSWTFLMQAPNASQAHRITRYLEDNKLEYSIRPDGIYVKSESDKYKAQFGIAGEGIIGGGSQIGWDIFMKPSVGTTSKILEIQRVQAKKTSAERSLMSSPYIRWAAVQMDVPEDRLFPDPDEKPTASVTLEIAGALTPEQVRSVQNVVAAIQVGLDPADVTVMDTDLNLLSEGARVDPMATATAGQLEIKDRIERNLEDKALQILLPAVGKGKARVKVNADLAFNDREITRREVDPDSTVVVSEETESEETQNMRTAPAPGAEANLPGEAPTGTGTGTSSVKERSSTETEVSRTETRESVRGHEIERLSIAILVDGRYASPAEGGVPVFEARTAEELETYRTMVANAVGYDEKRDGNAAITITCAPFEHAPVVTATMATSAMEYFSSPREVLAPILLILIPVICYLAYRRIDRRREEVRQKFQKHMEGLLKPLKGERGISTDDDFDIDFRNRDLSQLPEEERRVIKLQEKLADFAKTNPEEFAGILKGWLKE